MGYILLLYICWKRTIPHSIEEEIWCFRWKMTKLCMVYWQGRPNERPTDWGTLSLIVNSRAPVVCPMVGMKLISKPVDGLHSTAIYLLKGDNLSIQTSKRYPYFGKKWQSYVWSVDKVDRPSDQLSVTSSRSVPIPAPRCCVSDGRNVINMKTRRWATFYCYVFVERG